MNSAPDPRNRSPDYRAGIRILNPRSVIPGDEYESVYERIKILKLDEGEISFEIDHALSLSAIIAVKTGLKHAHNESTKEVYKIYRGKVQACNRTENSIGNRYEVHVRIFETALQTEVLASRFVRNLN